MNPTKIRCPHCGNSILIKQSGKSVCPSCHTPLYIEEKDKSVNVNVNLARAERSEAKIKGVFLFLIVLIAMSSMLILLLPRLFRAGEKVQRTVAPKYKESISDPVLTRLFAEAFEKDPASFTEDDILAADSSMGLAANAADPHFWFDVKLYEKACDEAAKALIEKLPAHEKEIQANLEAYRKKLDALDEEIREALAEIPEESRILVTPHDAFHYFSNRYGIEVKAPQGVSTDAELSTNDMAETADFIVAHKIKAIFAESTTDPARMEKLKESCAARGFAVEVVSGGNAELYSDSLAQKGEEGDTYITMVEHNVKLIAEHLK